MTNQFRRGISGATFFQLVAEVSWIVAAVLLALRLRDLRPSPSLFGEFVPAFVFAVVMVILSGVFGLYRRDRKLQPWAYVGRLLVAMIIGAPIAYFTAAHLPGGSEFRQVLEHTVLLAFGGLVVVRLAIVAPLVRRLLPHRVLVLGTGAEARAVEVSLAAAGLSDLHLVGFYPLENAREVAVSPRTIVRKEGTLDKTVHDLAIDEIIVAVREQRGGVLPLKALLDCRLLGVQITDLARFYETVHGRIPIDALKASWLIYGNGFRQNWLRTFVKRAFDIVVSVGLLIATMPIVVLTAILVAVEGSGPVIYRQERVGLRGKTFNVLKFRSMRQDAEKDGQARWAAVGDARVTGLGRFLRRTRIDELPQLVNVLCGEMSFVGPRPERPIFVSMLTEQIPFYAVRQSIKPGLTGWAQVRYSYGANVEQSMKKLEYDLYYVKNHTLFLDVLILFETVRVVLVGQGAR